MSNHVSPKSASSAAGCTASSIAGTRPGHSLSSLWKIYVEFGRYGNLWITSLVFIPYILGILLAARLHAPPFPDATTLASTCLFFVPASTVLHGAGCSWNDLVDEPIDRLVKRTRHRPLVRGAISQSHARWFTVAQTLLWFGLLRVMGPDVPRWGVPLVPGVAAYPYAKRFTPIPSVMLGIVLAYGLLIGYMSLPSSPTVAMEGPIAAGLLCIGAAYAIFIAAIDMIYAHQDLPDDLQAGIKSMAITFRGAPKVTLLVLAMLQCGCLVAAGRILHLGHLYMWLAGGGGIVLNATMIAKVDLANSASCFWWFQCGAAAMGTCLVAAVTTEFR